MLKPTIARRLWATPAAYSERATALARKADSPQLSPNFRRKM